MWGLRVALVLGIVTLFWALWRSGATTAVWPWAVLVAFVFAEQYAERWLSRRAWRAQSEALWRLEFESAVRLLDELRDFAQGQPRELLRIELQRGAIHSMRGRFADARAIYEKLIEEPQLLGYRAVVENNLAWSLMHLGVVGRALELSRNALAEGEAKRAPHVGLYRGTYAVGLVIAHRCEEAVPMLEQVLAQHSRDGAHAQAARAFYLGEALTELRRVEQARAAYERAAREAPTSIWAEQARAKLGVTHPVRSP
jgi:tetratricopeptide (TPR) repeat protein